VLPAFGLQQHCLDAGEIDLNILEGLLGPLLLLDTL
jgi:hypothetical protein